MHQYINCYTETYDTHKEIRYKTLNWPMIIGLSSTIFMMFSALIVGGVYGVVDNNSILSVYCFTLSAVLLICCYQLPMTVIKHIKTPTTKYREINSQFMDDKINVNFDEDSVSLDYENIIKLKETRNFYIIVFDCKQNGRKYLAIKKDGLNCNPQNFKDFILEKKNNNARHG